MSLNSTSRIKIIDLISEGPILGTHGAGGGDDGRRNIFLDKTPLVEEIGGSDQINFEGVSVQERQGHENQDALPTEYTAENAWVSTLTSVGVEVGKSYSETKKKNEAGYEINDQIVNMDYGGCSGSSDQGGQTITSSSKGTSFSFGGYDLHSPVVRTIPNDSVTHVKLIFTIGALYSVAQESLAKGQLFWGRIKVKISGKAQNANYGSPIEITKQGICTEGYQFKSPLIPLLEADGVWRGPYSIKVEKITDGENDYEIKRQFFEDIELNIPLESGRRNQLVWSHIEEKKAVNPNNASEVAAQTWSYPNSALMGLSIPTTQFASLPERAYRVRGRTVDVPDNAVVRDDGSLAFPAGANFNGGVRPEKKYTTCPVCCMIDLLTNERYGCGEFISKDKISWIDYYPLIKYANELITTATGTEPRFAINTTIGSQEDAYAVLQDMASVFRGITYWANNTIQISGDGNWDTTSKHVFTNSNVVGGYFLYQGSSLKKRATSLKIRYNDPEDFYKSNYVIQQVDDLIDKYGYNEREIVAFGCSSRTQAQRMARWILKTEELADETVSFSVGLEGLFVLPGQIFNISDQMRAADRYGGLIASATTSSIVVDAYPDNLSSNSKLHCMIPPEGASNATWSQAGTTITITSNSHGFAVDDQVYIGVTSGGASSDYYVVVTSATNSFTVEATDELTASGSCTVADPNTEGAVTMESRSFTYNSTTKTFSVTSPFSRAPVVQSPFHVTDADSIPQQQYRCLGIAENKEEATYTIEAVRFDPNIYNYVDNVNNDAPPINTKINLANVNPPAPISITLKANSERENNNTINTVNVSWQPFEGSSAGVSFTYELRWRIGDGGNWQHLETNSTGTTLKNIPVGTKVYAQVRAKSLLDNQRHSRWVIAGVFTVPVETQSDYVQADSLLPPDIYNLYAQIIGEHLNLSWNFDNSGQNLNELKVVIRHSADVTGSAAWSSSVRYAAISATTDQITLPVVNGEYLVKLENPKGRKSQNAKSVVVNITSSVANKVIHTANEKTSNYPGEKIGCGYSGSLGGLVLNANQRNGTYYFQNLETDLGGVYEVKLKRDFVGRGLILDDLIGEYVNGIAVGRGLIDLWPSVDGPEADNNSSELYFRVSTDATEPNQHWLLEDGDALAQETALTDLLLTEISSLFGDWIVFREGRYSGRVFQFKAELERTDMNETPLIDNLGCTINLDLRIESPETAISSAMTGDPQPPKPITYPKPFYSTPDVAINVNNLNSGEYYEITSESKTGFSVIFKNSSNAVITKNFKYHAVGYGAKEA